MRIAVTPLLLGPVLGLALVACRPNHDAAPPEPTPTTSEGEPPPSTKAAAAPCEPLGPRQAADAAAERGMAKLQEAREGEHYRAGPLQEAMAALRDAAEQGHLGAQSLYGKTMFETRFLAQAPAPEEREDYVAAFTFLRIAALRGDPAVQDYVPGLTADAPPVHDEPLSQLPVAWLTEAYARADAWMACHGQAVGDRGATP